MVREAIEKAMAAKELDGVKLAAKAKVPTSVVYRFLAGSKRVELKHVDAMLKALGLTVVPALLARPARRRRT
jgi:predicted transcriptional regulator